MNESNKFTPGPWDKNRFGEVVDKNGELVRIEGFALSGISNPETRANRDLAFAAPDLLEALSELYECCYEINNPQWEKSPAQIKAMIAINKARGQQ